MSQALYFCYDCEAEIPDGRVFCDSCEAHRDEDGNHGPRPEYCHGAGPDGNRIDRLLQVPRALSSKERTWV